VKRYAVLDLILLVMIAVFLLTFLTPRYLLSVTTATGGDMGSHFPTAVHMKNVFLKSGKVMGWDQANYAGYPLFYHYFPLTFIVTAILSLAMPMEVAFKLTTVLGVFLLPVCVCLALRVMKFKFPIPIVGAIFSTAFLLHEANSMWGGNILSMLAGEYSYSLSLALMVLLSGTLYAGIEEGKWIFRNAFLVFLIGFSHGFTLVFSCVIAVFFVITLRDFRKNFWYLFKVYGLGGLLLSFWIVPFYFNLPYTTSFVTKWRVDAWREYAPVILWPFAGLAALALVLNLFDRRTHYLVYIIAASIVMYFTGTYLGMLDIRFVPFTQLYVTIFAATAFMVCLKAIRFRSILALILFVASVLWIHPKVKNARHWMKWNYEGLEEKSSWPRLQSILSFLRESGDGRIAYEHTPDNNSFGTERIFENLHYFTGRGTLEGLYMQSAVSSPFVFYIQSQYGKICSAPFPQYPYSHLNLRAAIPRLNIFNVTHYIARSPQAKAEARQRPELKLEKTVGGYEIYRVTTADGRYVVPLTLKPILFHTDDWKNDFHKWFVNPNLLDITLVRAEKKDRRGNERFDLESDSLLALRRAPLEVPDVNIDVTMKDEEIEFRTPLVGHPHLIRVSYHPNWHVKGADRIYLASPCFMLVFPTQENVRLYFGRRFPNYLGEFMSLVGLGIILYPVFRRVRKRSVLSG